MITFRLGLITLYHREDVLDLISRRDCYLPTWVPDFAVHFETHAIIRLEHFKATGKAPLSSNSPTIEGQFLRVLGAVFNNVTTTSGPLYSDVIGKSFIRMLQSMPHLYGPTGQISVEALW